MTSPTLYNLYHGYFTPTTRAQETSHMGRIAWFFVHPSQIAKKKLAERLRGKL
jgi:hypothetical protein